VTSIETRETDWQQFCLINTMLFSITNV